MKSRSWELRELVEALDEFLETLKIREGQTMWERIDELLETEAMYKSLEK